METTAIMRRDKERKKESDVYMMPWVTELTVCQPNTGSTVQLPLLFIPPVDSLAGIYARNERHPDTASTPPTSAYPTLCRSTPTWKSIIYPTLFAAALIFYQRRREIYKNTRARPSPKRADAKCIDWWDNLRHVSIDPLLWKLKEIKNKNNFANLRYPDILFR